MLRLTALLLATGLVLGSSGVTSHPDDDGPSTWAPVWTTHLPESNGLVEAGDVVGDVVLAANSYWVTGLDRRTGTTRWSRPKYLSSSISLAADAMVELSDSQPDQVMVFDQATQYNLATVYDLATGAQRFAIPREASDWIVATSELLLIGTCRPGQPCRLTARELRTGATVWQLAFPMTGTDHDVDTAQQTFLMPHRLEGTWRAPEPGLMVVRGVVDPKADAVPMVTVDLRSGTLVSTWAAAGPRDRPKWRAFYIGDLLIDSPSRLTPAGQGQLLVYDLRANALRWRLPVTVPDPLGNNGGFAMGVVDSAAHPALHIETADQRPQVIDLATGTVRWTGDRNTRLLALDSGTAVITDDDYGRGHGALVGLDAATGAPRWTTPQPAPPHCTKARPLGYWVMADGLLLHTGLTNVPNPANTYGRCGENNTHYLRMIDIATGVVKRTEYGVELVGSGRDWIMASVEPDKVRLYQR